MLSPTSRQGEKYGRKWSTEQELYGALAQGLQGLQKTLKEGEELQRARTTRCLQLLAREIRDRWVWARRAAWRFQESRPPLEELN